MNDPAFKPESQPRTCVVIGAGVIGLSIARALAARDLAVTVCDRGRAGSEASHAAAGMLCPSLEFTEGSALLDLGRRSLALYPSFVRELEEETGVDLDLRLDGMLRPLAASDRPPVPPPETRLLEGAALHEFEPGLASEYRRAVVHFGEGSVDNRAMVRALIESCRRRGVDLRENCAVIEVLEKASSVRGVRLETATLAADVVVNAAGAWAGKIRAPGPPLAIRPVKGQMLLLDAGGGAPAHTIYASTAYIVPRTDGRVIVGTTVEDRGYDKTVEENVISRLRAAAAGLVPALESAPLGESWAGLRPRGETELPMLGPHGPSGYHVAVGHFRNGILLTPVSAEVVAGAIVPAAGAPPGG